MNRLRNKRSKLEIKHFIFNISSTVNSTLVTVVCRLLLIGYCYKNELHSAHAGLAVCVSILHSLNFSLPMFAGLVFAQRLHKQTAV